MLHVPLFFSSQESSRTPPLEPLPMLADQSGRMIEQTVNGARPAALNALTRLHRQDGSRASRLPRVALALFGAIGVFQLLAAHAWSRAEERPGPVA